MTDQNNDNENAVGLPFDSLPTSAPVASPSDMLRQATQLVKSGDRPGAKKLVADVLKANKENADAWYLYSYLIEDPAKKIQGLERALAINPQHARAKQLLETLKPEDAFADLLPHPSPMQVYTQAPIMQQPMQPTINQGQGMPQQFPMQQPVQPMMQQPIVYVNVNQSNDNYNTLGGGARVNVNQLALILGFIAAGFFGIFGVAHLLTGKIGGALGRFVLGICWLFFAGFGIALTAGLGACLFVPLHFYLAWTWSKAGATVTA